MNSGIEYFVVVEVNRYGFFIGSYTSFSEAEKEFKKIVELSSRYSFPDSECIMADLVNYKRYYIKNDQFFNGDDRQMISNGVLSIYIYELGKKWKSTESFIKEREFQNKIFLDE